ncbi:hypothetical protein ACPOL_5948 [Acidisarcina polymorpha]|uniref:Zinc-finger domain-containing protein n=2 Tax=Acidisarcina polymorpha TaxID=2211140 RepID=A0A2Z5G7G5_9BACT|nr:hypothetical protein ACPOL_5948 [Acidisarcina polymorpha]
MIQMREREEGSALAARNGRGMTCEEFQDQMKDLIGDDIRDHEHLKTCDRCTALLEELEYIVDIAKGLLPSYEPSDKVWQKITGSLHQEEESGAGDFKPQPPKN